MRNREHRRVAFKSLEVVLFCFLLYTYNIQISNSNAIEMKIPFTNLCNFVIGKVHIHIVLIEYVYILGSRMLFHFVLANWLKSLNFCFLVHYYIELYECKVSRCFCVVLCNVLSSFNLDDVYKVL